jgi:phage terminase small subunit
MRGRKPKSIECQIAEGDPRKHGVHKLDEMLASQPKSQRGLRECPPYLSKEAKEAWDFWKAQLETMDLDYQAYALSLAAGCMAFQNLRRAHQSKDWGLMAKFFQCVMKFTSEFGLTPVSKARLTLDKPDDGEAELMAILAGPREKKPNLQ